MERIGTARRETTTREYFLYIIHKDIFIRTTSLNY